MKALKFKIKEREKNTIKIVMFNIFRSLMKLSLCFTYFLSFDVFLGFVYMKKRKGVLMERGGKVWIILMRIKGLLQQGINRGEK